ncbi:hypothetical protein INP83_09870 [Mucilaginibacter sp. 21P]|uniref:hypothetical protein n=1 Tax=Mucilaginibacter sp. 21P TaxID=2778902 RepID=UPI001C598886|nr:hypothetical protein [Mucilaginibacter sp. 21P]QXV67371.1 hypothetical protein INP83_09870 [Mucilaginibacter sp. 21P]
MVHPLDFYTQYSQFYVSDKDTLGDTSSDKFWTDDAFSDRLAMEEGIIGVGTECYGPIKGELEILERENKSFIAADYDHIVEGNIRIDSGGIKVIDCPTSTVELEIPVENGIYRVRVYSSNLSSVDGDEGDDFYRIEMWPSPKLERKVLKQYPT